MSGKSRHGSEKSTMPRGRRKKAAVGLRRLAVEPKSHRLSGSGLMVAPHTRLWRNNMRLWRLLLSYKISSPQKKIAVCLETEILTAGRKTSALACEKSPWVWKVDQKRHSLSGKSSYVYGRIHSRPWVLKVGVDLVNLDVDAKNGRRLRKIGRRAWKIRS